LLRDVGLIPMLDKVLDLYIYILNKTNLHWQNIFIKLISNDTIQLVQVGPKILMVQIKICHTYAIHWGGGTPNLKVLRDF
jgi:hypothetical protein